MPRVTYRDLRAHLATWLDRVAAGERVEVVRRGEVVAVIAAPMPRGTDAEVAAAAREFVGRINEIERSEDER